MNNKRILSIDEFVAKMKADNETPTGEQTKPKHIEEEEVIKSKPNLPELKKGNIVEDRYGNRYEVCEITKDYTVADTVDDWEQIKKYKDDKDVTFVIVWAKESKEKKFVFVYGVVDDYAVRKIDTKHIDEEDKLTKVYKEVCNRIDDTEVLADFKRRWRKFMDLVRGGKISNEKHIMLEILDDFKMTDIVKKTEKPKVEEETKLTKHTLINEGEDIKPALGDMIEKNVYEVILKGITYYVHPKNGDTEVIAFTTKDLTTAVKINDKDLTFKVKDLFGLEKWQTVIVSDTSGEN